MDVLSILFELFMYMYEYIDIRKYFRIYIILSLINYLNKD